MEPNPFKWNKPIPLGYRPTPDGWIEKIPEFVPLVKEIFEQFLATKNYAEVARIVNAKYPELMKGDRLTPHQIKRILSDPVYCGKPVLHLSIRR